MNMFYYHQWNPAEQMVYRKIARALGRRSPEIILRADDIPVPKLRQIALSVTLDFPEYYWSKGSFDLRPGSRRDRDVFRIALPSLFTEEEILRCDPVILRELSALLADLPADPARAVQTVCRRITEFAAYDLSPDPLTDRRNQTIWSVLIGKKSVCMGLAKTLHLAMRLMNLESILVLGHVFGDHENGHSWNMVRIDGRWLHVDVTMGYECFRPLWEQAHPGEPCNCLPAPFEALAATHEMRPEYPYPGTFGSPGSL